MSSESKPADAAGLWGGCVVKLQFVLSHGQDQRPRANDKFPKSLRAPEGKKSGQVAFTVLRAAIAQVAQMAVLFRGLGAEVQYDRAKSRAYDQPCLVAASVEGAACCTSCERSPSRSRLKSASRSSDAHHRSCSTAALRTNGDAITAAKAAAAAALAPRHEESTCSALV